MDAELGTSEGNVFGRVLFDDAPFFRSSEKGRKRDASSWPFIVEELIAFGATDMVIPKISLALYAMDVLPDSLRKRIIIIDKKKRYSNLLTCFSVQLPKILDSRWVHGLSLGCERFQKP
jgi:hypothetical protein